MAIRGPHFQRLVRWARQGLSGWRKAREAAIELVERWGSFARVAQMGKTSRQWVHKWWTRYQAADEDPSALEGRSSRPHNIHRERDAYEGGDSRGEGPVPDAWAPEAEAPGRHPPEPGLDLEGAPGT